MPRLTLKTLFPEFLSGILNSYTQIFFSDSRIFAWILVVVSFFDFEAGAAGLLAVLITNLAAFLIGFNTEKIRKGYYGFNSLLVGLGLGIYYQPGTAFFIILISSAILTLFITTWMEGAIGKYALPYMSLPFLAGTWLVTLATRQFAMLEVSERGIFMTNELYELGGRQMVDTYNLMREIDIGDSVRIYFKSLGAIFFQYHLLAGILISVGLLIHSRISFLLSILGFFTAYFYYQVIGADIHELSYSYIGFNFILTAIALGGFFIIPSRWSFLWVILLTPVISIILTSTQAVFGLFQLSVYSLPFNIVVLIFLYALKFRERFLDKPEVVAYQQYSPEKNLYSHVNYKARFGRSLFFPFILPFWGEWKVTQGYSGQHTHRGEWRHALDFEVAGEQDTMFSGGGTQREDYHAFGKPVIAPADGVIEQVVEDVEENDIGKIDPENNWGNTIVIRHSDHLFTKLSHLRKGSIKVRSGDPVRKGQVLAQCGNTGRSPVPHIHFQVQSTPYIGSKTLDYPLSHFIRHSGGVYELRSWEVPQEGVRVSNISRNSSLEKAFRFIPGQKFTLDVTTPAGQTTRMEWEVQLDSLNNTFIRCLETNSLAYFRNDGDIHYFTHFEGDRQSLLYKFYLSAYKVMMGYYKNLNVYDQFPVNAFNNRLAAIGQDLFAPFVIFTRSDYRMQYLAMGDDLMETKIHLRSSVSARIWGVNLKSLEADFMVNQHGLESFICREKDQIIKVKFGEEV